MISKSILSVSIAAALAVNAGIVSANTSNDNDKEDSVNEWGPWAGIQTAAGPQNVNQPPTFIAFNPNNPTDSDSFVPDVNQNDGNEGFRQYANWKQTNNGGEAQVAQAINVGMVRKCDGCFFLYRQNGQERVGITLGFNPADGGEGSQASFRVVRPGGQEISASNLAYNGSKRSREFYGQDVGGAPGTFSSLQRQQSEDNSFQYGGWEQSQYEQIVYEYEGEGFDGCEGDCSPSPMVFLSNRQDGSFIIGQTSTIAAINNLGNLGIEGSVPVTFRGNFLSNNFDSSVTIVANIRSSSWQGNFAANGWNFSVSDGAINGVDLSGNVSDGLIQGLGGNQAFIQPANVDVADITGTVDASFFGSAAETIGGIAEVERGAEKFVEVFKVDSQQAQVIDTDI